MSVEKQNLNQNLGTLSLVLFPLHAAGETRMEGCVLGQHSACKAASPFDLPSHCLECAEHQALGMGLYEDTRFQVCALKWSGI